MARRKCAIDIALHDLAGKVAGRRRSTSCSVCRRTSHRPTSRSASTSRRSSPSGRAGRPTFPALKIKVGGPADLATLRAVREVFGGPDPGRREHRLDPRRTPSACCRSSSTSASSSSSSRSRPRAYRDLGWLQERSRAADRGRRECVTPEDLDALSASSPASTSSSRSAAGSAPAQRDARAGPRARLPDVPRLHGGDVGRDRRRRRSSRRSPNGSTSTAACCSPTTRSRASSSARTSAGACRPPGPRADPASRDLNRLRHVPHGRSTRTPVRVDKLVDEVVDKPPSGRSPARPRMSDTGRRAPREGGPGTPGPRPADGPDTTVRPGRLRIAVDAERAPAPSGRQRASRREGTPSMDPRPAATRVPDPDAVEFIRFCYRRRRVGWPELYDEMCAVAARGPVPRLGADDLADHGIGFGLFDMPALAAMAARIVAEEQALRRPVAVGSLADRSPGRAGTEDVRGDRRRRHRGRHRPRWRRPSDAPVRFAAVPAGA